MFWEPEDRTSRGADSVEAGTNRSAQDWFRLMLDTGLAPGFHALGFTGFPGSGRRFRKRAAGHWAEVSIIQSRSLTEGCVRFTLLLRAIVRDEWSEQLRVRPYSSPPRDLPGWEAPIGALVTVGGHPIEELWWTLEAGKPFDSLADEVLTTLETFGLPALSHHIRAAG